MGRLNRPAASPQQPPGDDSARADLGDHDRLAANNGRSPEPSDWRLGASIGVPVAHDLRSRRRAVMCASLPRAPMWRMISERRPASDGDDVAWMAEKRVCLERAFGAFADAEDA